MRTVVFVGLLIIGDALRHQAGMDKVESVGVADIGMILVCAIVMDVVEFFVRISKK